MKRVLILTASLVFLAPLILSQTQTRPPPAATQGATPAATPLKLPGVIMLGAEAKFGPVTFNHTEHATGKRNIAGTGGRLPASSVTTRRSLPPRPPRGRRYKPLGRPTARPH
jgi:hypothetical protein